ncbi:MAG: DnaJ domain-containing protein, partial [Clostridia bacterium]
MAKDYYKILGVDKNATEDEIKSAYRQLAKKYHPDLHPNDKEASEKFKECNEAYSVIGDKENRGKYDRGEMDFQGNGGANPFEGFHFTSASGFDDIFSDLFSGFMGGGGRRQSATPVGTDINCNIKLTFMEAALGVKKKVTFSRMEKCSDCKGTGGKDASSVKTCDKCGGSGKLNYTQ